MERDAKRGFAFYSGKLEDPQLGQEAVTPASPTLLSSECAARAY